MAILTVSINRTQTANVKNGTVSILVKATGSVLASRSENFPLDTSGDYILSILLGRAKEMMRELALAQVPNSFSFDIDSEQIKLRRLFDL